MPPGDALHRVEDMKHVLALARETFAQLARHRYRERVGGRELSQESDERLGQPVGKAPERKGMLDTGDLGIANVNGFQVRAADVNPQNRTTHDASSDIMIQVSNDAESSRRGGARRGPRHSLEGAPGL
jgi:hypothetical protein